MDDEEVTTTTEDPWLTLEQTLMEVIDVPGHRPFLKPTCKRLARPVSPTHIYRAPINCDGKWCMFRKGRWTFRMRSRGMIDRP